MAAQSQSSTRGSPKLRAITPEPSSDLSHLFDAPMEAVLLGTVLSDGEPAYRQIRFLESADFGLERHRIVWEQIVAVADEVHPTLDEVYQRLSSSGAQESAGGLEYLIELHRQGIPGLPLTGFARAIHEKAAQRRVWTLNSKLSTLLELGSDPRSPDFQSAVAELSAATQVPSDARSHRVEKIGELPAVGADNEVFTFIRNPELPCAAVIALTGDSGSGKSTLASAWVRDAIASGTPCLVLDRENPRAVIRDRMLRIGLEDGPLLRWFGGWNGEVPELNSPIVREWVDQCNPKPLIVVDSLIAFIGGDENDALIMRSFTDQARKLADLGATIVVIHHDGKAETARDFRGSSDFKASFDQAFHVSNIGPDSKLDRIKLRCFKSRYGLTNSIIYRYAEGRLLRDEHVDAPERTAADEFESLLRLNPGVGAKKFEDLAGKQGLGRNQARDFLSNGVLADKIRQEKGARNERRHYLKEAE